MRKRGTAVLLDVVLPARDDDEIGVEYTVYFMVDSKTKVCLRRKYATWAILAEGE